MPQPAIRSYLNAGFALTAATAIALTPLVIPESHPPVTVPRVTVSDVQLTVNPADIEAFIANVQAVLDDATTTVQGVVGIPGQTLIGLVNNNILTLIDDVFTGLIAATDNPTLVASLTILKTLTYDAFVMLGVNLGRINPVISTTTEQVGELLTGALTGSLQNMLIAVANVANDPLAPAGYAGLLTAGVASGQLLAGNGLQAVQALGDGGFEIAGIALDELTFQFNNAVSGLSALATQLGDASGNAIVQSVIAAVRGLVVAPAVAVFNLGSSTIGTVVTAANAGFNLVLDGATSIVNPTINAPQSATNAVAASPLDPAAVNSAMAEEVQATSFTLTTAERGAQSDDVVPVVDETEGDDVVTEKPVVEDAVKDAPAEDVVEDEADEASAAADKEAAPDNQSDDDSTGGGPVATGVRLHRSGPIDASIQRNRTSRGAVGIQDHTPENKHGGDDGSATDHDDASHRFHDTDAQGTSESNE